MTTDIAKLVKQSFDVQRERIVSEYDRKGMRASGEFERLTEVKQIVDGTNIVTTMYAPTYVKQLEEGRRPTSSGAARANPSLKDRILQWIDDKGLSYSGITKESLAFLIARKIHREGWNRNGYGGVDLLTDAKLTEFIELTLADTIAETRKVVAFNILKAWQSK